MPRFRCLKGIKADASPLGDKASKSRELLLRTRGTRAFQSDIGALCELEGAERLAL